MDEEVVEEYGEEEEVVEEYGEEAQEEGPRKMTMADIMAEKLR